MAIERTTPLLAQRLLDAAQNHAESIGVAMCFAIVDESGALTDLRRMPGAGWATVALAHGKARACAAFDAPTSALADRWQSAGLFTTALITQSGGPFVPAPGGVPLVLDGTQIGAIGASGGTGAQDESVVTGAVNAIPELD